MSESIKLLTNTNINTYINPVVESALETAKLSGDFKGEKGDQGIQGPKGDPGPQGPAGADGTMTFEDLTEEQRASLKGEKGDPGISSIYIGSGEMPDGCIIQIDPDCPQYFPNFATPQMYGAVGDGITDDTLAINQCLHNNKYVFFPAGFYRISYPINLYSRNAITVKCAVKTVFIADDSFEDKYYYNDDPTKVAYYSNITDTLDYIKTNSAMLMISHHNYTTGEEGGGYSTFACSWEGGIFCCSGLANLRGIRCHNKSAWATLKDITIVDIGNQGIGIDIYDCKSAKIHLDNIRCFGQTFRFNGNLPDCDNLKDDTFSGFDGNISIDKGSFATYIARDNIGLRVYDSYDFEIGTLYTMSCRVGIEANKSQQVNVHYYHYWLGTDGEGREGKIAYADFIQSRAFKGTAYWHFDMFYPDKPYIAFEGNNISCDNTHYICPPIDCIDYITEIKNDDGTATNALNGDRHCYLGKLISMSGNIFFGDCDISEADYNDVPRLPCGGVITATTKKDASVSDEEAPSRIPYFRNSVKIQDKYWQYHDKYLHPSWSFNYSNLGARLDYNAGKWVVLGYICASIAGRLTLRLSPFDGTNTNIECTIKTDGYHSTKIIKLDGVTLGQATNEKPQIGLGSYFNKNGYNWVPVLFKQETGGTLYLQTEYGNIVPFVLSSNLTKANDNKKFLLIGDSYGQGSGGQSGVSGWAELFKNSVEALGHECTINTLGGAGFARAVQQTQDTGTDDKKVYFENLLSTYTVTYTDAKYTITSEPPISEQYKNAITDIIILGGYNDLYNDEASYVEGALRTKIEKFIIEAKSIYSNAKIHIGMVGYSTDDTDNTRIKTEVLSEYVALDGCGMQYITGIENVLNDSLIAADNVHPKQEGYDAIHEYLLNYIQTGFAFADSSLTNYTTDI